MQMSQRKLEEIMQLTLKLAIKAHDSGNSPFGAIITDQEGKILSKATNTTNTDINPLAHAEMNALIRLVKKMKQKKFQNLVLFSNVQSCPMCFSALYRSGFRYFVYGCEEDETLVPKISVFEMNHYCKEKAEIISGILKTECMHQLEKARNA